MDVSDRRLTDNLIRNIREMQAGWVKANGLKFELSD